VLATKHVFIDTGYLLFKLLSIKPLETLMSSGKSSEPFINLTPYHPVFPKHRTGICICIYYDCCFEQS